MISVSRKSHIPKVPASRCCSCVSKWWRCCGRATCWCSAATAVSCVCGCVATIALSNGRHLLFRLVGEPLVVIGLMIDDRNLDKVFGQRRRLNLPLKAGCLPRIVARDGAIFQRPSQIKKGKHVTHAQHRRTGSGQNIQHLELRRIRVVTTRHAKISKDELGQEREVEADKGCNSCQLRKRLRI